MIRQEVSLGRPASAPELRWSLGERALCPSPPGKKKKPQRAAAGGRGQVRGCLAIRLHN